MTYQPYKSILLRSFKLIAKMIIHVCLLARKDSVVPPYTTTSTPLHTPKVNLYISYIAETCEI